MTFPLDLMGKLFKGSLPLSNPCRYWVRPTRSRLIYTVPGYDNLYDWLQNTNSISAVAVIKVWQTLSLTEILLRIRSSLTLTKSLSYSLNLKTGA